MLLPRLWSRGLILLAVVAGMYGLVSRLDGHALLRGLASARPVMLVAACALALVQLAFRSAAFRSLLLPLARPPWMRVQRFMVASAVASALAPGRPGELLRAYLLKRDDNVPVASTAAVTAVEKIVQLLALSLLLAPLPLFLPDLPTWAVRSLWVAAVLGPALFVSAICLARRKRPPRWMANFVAGLQIVRQPPVLGWALLTSIAGWVADALCLTITMRAVGISAPAAASLLSILGVNLAIAVPVVPGNLGTFELGVVAGLQPFGVGHELALVAGILYHLAQVVPIALIALAGRRPKQGTTASLDAADRTEVSLDSKSDEVVSD